MKTDNEIRRNQIVECCLERRYQIPIDVFYTDGSNIILLSPHPADEPARSWIDKFKYDIEAFLGLSKFNRYHVRFHEDTLYPKCSHATIRLPVSLMPEPEPIETAEYV